MRVLASLKQDLAEYHQLSYHNDPVLAAILAKVQWWQRERIRRTHAALFDEPKHQAMADFLINKLYGGDAFERLATQLERIIPKAEKLEKLIPESALHTGVLGIEAALEAIRLDLHLAEYIQNNQLLTPSEIADPTATLTETIMLQAYRGVNEEKARHQQIEQLRHVCYQTDKYIKSFVLQKAFAFAKGTAYKYDYQPLYDFVAEGFEAIKPIKSIGAFIDPFCAKENAIIDNVHSGKPNPFVV